MKNVNYVKTKQAIKYWLLGKAEHNHQYYDVLKAMDYAEKITTGFRKDGVTPVFQHQVSIALYLKTIHAFFINPVEVFVLAFLHDVYEDYPEAIGELENLFPQYVEKVKVLSKRDFSSNGELINKSYQDYFTEMQKCPSCSLVKGVDRLHNLATMIGVFNKEKQLSYCQEVEDYFLPMLKQARKTFPEQENAYENLKSVLSLQIETVKGLHLN